MSMSLKSKQVLLGVGVFLVFLITAGTWASCGDDTPKPDPPAQSKQDRMRELKEDLDDGTITQEEYEKKIEELKGEPDVEPREAPGKFNAQGTTTGEIEDPAWGVTAYTMQIPENWNFEGAVLRDQDCGYEAGITWRLSSPDGLYGAQELPEFHSLDTNQDVFRPIWAQHQCKVMSPPLAAADVLPYYAQFARPNPSVGNIGETADAQDWQNKMEANNRGPAAGLLHWQGGTAESRIEYTFHGQPIEEDFSVRLQVRQKKVEPIIKSFYEWRSIGYVFGIRAPKGQLDSVKKKILEYVNTGGFTQEWAKANFNKQLSDIQAARRWGQAVNQSVFHSIEVSHEAFMQAQQERFESNRRGVEDQLEAMHRSAQSYVLFASDEQLLRNPDTGEVFRSPISYGDNAWNDPISRGIIFADQPNVNPTLFMRGMWSQLEHVSPMDLR
jgi:hypothetical protein